MTESSNAQAPNRVTIIGAGLAGLTLALALHDNNIVSTIYECRSSSHAMGGGIMLSPNALRVLDSIGKPRSIYSRIRSKGYNFDKLSFVNDDHQVSDVYYFGHEQLYGYTGLRIYRQVLINELLMMCQERHITIEYNRSFSMVTSENANSVTFSMSDGEVIETPMLIGADGIHSAVRQYLSDVTPQFGGLLAIIGHIPTSTIDLPENYPLPVTIQGKGGAFVIAPQDVDGSDCLVGVQRPFPSQDREGWTQLAQDKTKLYEMFTANKESMNDVVKSAMVAVKPEDLTIWPFHQIPNLKTWASKDERVIILGDAAHAIPPTAGQGVNQAFEDIWSFAILLAATKKQSVPLSTALRFWKDWRQARVEKVKTLTTQMNAKRLPEAERERAENPKGGQGELQWLYGCNIKEEMSAWLDVASVV